MPADGIAVDIRHRNFNGHRLTLLDKVAGCAQADVPVCRMEQQIGMTAPRLTVHIQDRCRGIYVHWEWSRFSLTGHSSAGRRVFTCREVNTQAVFAAGVCAGCERRADEVVAPRVVYARASKVVCAKASKTVTYSVKVHVIAKVIVMVIANHVVWAPPGRPLAEGKAGPVRRVVKTRRRSNQPVHLCRGQRTACIVTGADGRQRVAAGDMGPLTDESADFKLRPAELLHLNRVVMTCATLFEGAAGRP